MALWSANGLTLGAYLARNRQRSAFAANLSIGARAAQTIMAGAAQNLIHVCNASRADTRSIAGLTTGAQDAAALGAAGASIGGP
jgi:hypothetical protein